MKVKHIFIYLVLILFLFNCSNPDTAKLLDSSISTAKLLSEYYDTLIKYTIETWEMEAFNSSIRELDFPIEEQKEFLKTIDHLKARKKMADSFANILPLIEEYSQNNTGEKLNTSATALANSINELRPMQDSNVVIPSNIFGNLANDIIDIVRFFEIRHSAKILLSSLEKMKELFEKESPLYNAIIEERNNKSLIVINYLIDNELVAPWNIIQYVPANIDMEFASEKKPPKDDKTKTAIKKVVEVKYYRMKYLTQSAEEELKLLVSDLIKNYNEFLNGRRITFDNITYLINRTSDYLIQANEYYQRITTGNSSQSSEIIYHGNSETKIFHHPNCPYYFSKNCNVIFHTRDDAVSKGYSPCSTCKP